MNIRQFAKATGYSVEHIRRCCKKGKIPCDIWNGAYDIPPGIVPLWKGNKHRRMPAEPGAVHSSSLAYQRVLDQYNKAHGTSYSYGRAVMLGVIDDEQKR